MNTNMKQTDEKIWTVMQISAARERLKHNIGIVQFSVNKI